MAGAEIPNQKPLWDAYGHAMGAATGLELVMRIALLDAGRTHFADDPNARERLLSKVLKKTFGQTAKWFMEVYSGFGEDEKFVELMDDAVACRNYLAHHFLQSSLDGLRSEEGVQLLILHCAVGVQEFNELERFIRANCPADIDGFFELGAAQSERWVREHPMWDRLQEMKAAGELPSGLKL